MKILINYANDKYKRTQKFNSWTGRHVGKFDKIYSFGPEDIEEDFYEDNKEILGVSRGNGMWLWKPYLIDKVMKDSNEGDIIFYCDSGSFFIREIDNLIMSMDYNSKIWVSDIPLLEKNFTKTKCFEKLGCNQKKYKNTNQIQATFFMTINSKETRNFVSQWLDLCGDIELLGPSEDLSTEGNEFVAHREDQSLLSLLCKKNKIKAHLDPSQRGKYPYWYKDKKYPFVLPMHDDKYKPIIFLHKMPNVSIIKCIKQYLECRKKSILYVQK